MLGLVVLAGIGVFAVPLTSAGPGVEHGLSLGSALVWAGDAIVRPLTALGGDVERGRTIVASRQTGLCLLCHSLDASGAPNQGNLAPPLAGAGLRWNAGQLRARLVDSRRLNPASIMPAYFVASAGSSAASNVARLSSVTDAAAPRFLRVATAWQGRPLLDAQQIEDVVAYLLSLREPA